MTSDKLAEEYLRWRFESMKAEAPAAPSAAQLIQRARPWWEKWPERFRALIGRLEKIQSGNDHNGGQSDGSGVHTVPVLMVRGEEETEDFARVLDFKVHDGKLHFRFQVAPSLASGVSSFEATFISYPVSRALLFTPAFGSSEIGYIAYTELPPELAEAWTLLNETVPLPFRLILHSGPWA
jgi:hypothetical protein